MGKYAQALSIWEHEIAKGIIHKLKPIEDDNLEIIRLQKEAKKTKSQEIMLKGMKNLYLTMVERAYPEMIPEDKKEMEELVGQNVSSITEEMLIAFKLTTREDIKKFQDRYEEELLKQQVADVMSEGEEPPKK